MSRVNKKYPWPYNLAYDIFEGDEHFDEILPRALENTVETTLSERESRCIYLHYKDVKIYDDIGKEFGVTRERIRQIIAKALRKLRHPIRSGQFLAVPKSEYNELKKENAVLRSHLEELSKMLNIPPTQEPAAVAPFLETPIMKLDLSVRAYNCLVRNGGFRTYKDFINYKISNLMRIRNLGVHSFEEILDKLDKVGFKATDGNDVYSLKDWNRNYYSKDVFIWFGEEGDNGKTT